MFKSPKFSGVLWLTIILVGHVAQIQAQAIEEITLDSCQIWARLNHPMVFQSDLLNKTGQLQHENLRRNLFPQLNINGQATYQSEVTEIPIQIPGMEIPTLPHGQYQATFEILLPLIQRKSVNLRQDLSRIQNQSQQAQVDLSLHTLNKRVSTVYFQILLLDEYLRQFQLSQANLKDKIEQLEQAARYGVVLQHEIDQLRAESILMEQQIFSTQSQKDYFSEVLSVLTGRTITSETRLVRPTSPRQSTEMQRIEFTLFDLEKAAIDQEIQIHHESLKPMVHLFARGGIGRPGLNFLQDDISPFYLAGIQVNWKISSRYNLQRNHQLLDIKKRMVDTRIETFRLNTQIELDKYAREIERYHRLIEMDDQVLTLRSSSLQTAAEQLAKGIITSVQYTTILREEEKARLTRGQHELLLLQSYYNRQHENGF